MLESGEVKLQIQSKVVFVNEAQKFGVVTNSGYIHSKNIIAICCQRCMNQKACPDRAPVPS